MPDTYKALPALPALAAFRLEAPEILMDVDVDVAEDEDEDVCEMLRTDVCSAS